ncbi:PREDICTED: alanine--tRNA ligase, cytoplasmic-like [Amphimedon queenslandica]|uniref:Alanine--tRNA ligase n=1 Tax=Amphimedon queenslandica TaxID=400682 RepID=A0A1X7TVZ9_AMPQE|nr:PREDICTED: alanine--tRNA ligase, cytoplasmic-like [Amphimedon queenslandica]|eukprot:XP_011406711.1 PREDICTED: alanine--tRNA ligase, cytoplasmic-like [Amphimedon queenslandica]
MLIRRFYSHLPSTGGNVLTAKEIRRIFINYFQSKGHTFVPSSSTLPHNDQTLSFTNAGMNQFKPIFQGTIDPSSDFARLSRAVNYQKCIRAGGKHNDLDVVGKDTYHHTFFEMLGNWSFGDYFKKEAIEMAWSFLTDTLNLSKDRLYVTYFGGDEKLNLPPDDECRGIWINLGLSPERVLPFSVNDNFWEMGDTGPCGPCTEIHYDRIGGRFAANLVNMNDPDVLELWNIVIMQFNREADGSIKRLPRNYIDTGLGLERIVSVVQNKFSNYDTDLFVPIFDAIQQKTGFRGYGGRVGAEDIDGIDMAYRVVADHIRTLTVAISDGGRPATRGSNHVLRQILKRGVYYLTNKLNAKPCTFASLVPTVVDILGEAYPELTKDPERVMDIINEEEEHFLKSLSIGRIKFEEALQKVDNNILPGDVLCDLHIDTGLTIDLIQLMADERQVRVDIEGFKKAKALRQEHGGWISRPETSVQFDVHAIDYFTSKGLPPTDDIPKYNYSSDEFGNYSFPSCTSSIIALKQNGEFVDEVTSGQSVGVFTDKTCFYAEQGGQVCDKGFIVKTGEEKETKFMVNDVQVGGGYVMHVGTSEGTLRVGDTVDMIINGNSVTANKIKECEEIALEIIKANHPVYAKEAPLPIVKEIKGLRVINAEIYPNPVRVLSIGVPVDKLVEDPSGPWGTEYSVEFCCGTHLNLTSHIDSFVIVSEEGSGEGFRRIVALTGTEAIKAHERAAVVQERVSKLCSDVFRDIVEKTITPQEARELIGKELFVLQSDVISKWKKVELQNKLNTAKKSTKKAKKVMLNFAAEKCNGHIQELVGQFDKTNPPPFVVEKLEIKGSSMVIRAAMYEFKSLAPSIPAVLLSVDHENDKFICVASVPEGAVAKGLKANEWLQSISSTIDGKAGGNENSASISGTNFDKLSNAVDVAKQYAQEFFSCDIG